MNIRPIGERILIKTIKIEKKSASGIILSSKTEEAEQNIGEVIALGEGEKLAKISIGDKIIYDKYAGNMVRDGEEKLLIINAEDVLGIIE
ncbi:MAG: co-chaperone GroES [Fusobacterium sp.]|nr:co-chaperone GroES [Fusobacterium sp.]